jgi:hypothetical protein
MSQIQDTKDYERIPDGIPDEKISYDDLLRQTLALISSSNHVLYRHVFARFVRVSAGCASLSHTDTLPNIANEEGIHQIRSNVRGGALVLLVLAEMQQGQSKYWQCEQPLAELTTP